jgi:hypothetical protein
MFNGVKYLEFSFVYNHTNEGYCGIHLDRG